MPACLMCRICDAESTTMLCANCQRDVGRDSKKMDLYRKRFKHYRNRVRKIRDISEANAPVNQRKAFKIVKAIAQKRFGYKVEFERPFLPYILDIYIKELKLGIEIDSMVHESREKHDDQRDEFLSGKYGIRIVRFQDAAVTTPYFKQAVWGLCADGLVERAKMLADYAKSLGIKADRLVEGLTSAA